MTRQECLSVLLSGMDLAAELADKGYTLLAAGEMGIIQQTLAFPVSILPATMAVTPLSVWVTPWATTPLSAQKLTIHFLYSRRRGESPAIRPSSTMLK